jgi:hypothetical protein
MIAGQPPHPIDGILAELEDLMARAMGWALAEEVLTKQAPTPPAPA